jgi:hypothetical protein
MDANDSRQLLHITYGSILSAKDGSGKFLFKDEFYKTLFDHEEDHYSGLARHIGKHLELLKLPLNK